MECNLRWSLWQRAVPREGLSYWFIKEQHYQHLREWMPQALWRYLRGRGIPACISLKHYIVICLSMLDLYNKIISHSNKLWMIFYYDIMFPISSCGRHIFKTTPRFPSCGVTCSVWSPSLDVGWTSGYNEISITTMIVLLVNWIWVNQKKRLSWVGLAHSGVKRSEKKLSQWQLRSIH